MTQISYDQIAPLVSHHEIRGRQILAMFTCPVSGTQIQSSAHIQQKQSLSNSISNSAQRSVSYGIQNTVSQVIRDLFGYNLFGRIAGDVARQTVQHVTTQTSNQLSKSEVQEGIVIAFQKIQSKFTWDGTRFISTQEASSYISMFTQQLSSSPIQNAYDKRILARLMTEMIISDGDIDQEEEMLFFDLVDPELGTLEDFKNYPPLSLQELHNVTQGGVRKTMLMVIWALALCDENFEESERRLLLYYAKGLKIESTDLLSIQNAAQDFILQQYLARVFGSGMTQKKRDAFISFAHKLGISKDVALTAEANYQKQIS